MQGRRCCWPCAPAPGCALAPAAVEGHVTIDGVPVNEAAIIFVPLDHGRAKTGALIVDGQYTLPAQEGLLPGRYRVEIIDNPPLDSAEHGSPAAPAKLKRRRTLPAEFSHGSSLRFVVPPEGEAAPPYRASFDLKSSSSARGR